jgi:hypothetical protein
MTAFVEAFFVLLFDQYFYHWMWNIVYAPIYKKFHMLKICLIFNYLF